MNVPNTTTTTPTRDNPQPGGAFDAPGPGGDPSDTYDGDLSQYDDEYAAAQAVDHDEVPDGKYQVKVHTVKPGRTSKGNDALKWDLVVISGPHEGRHIFKTAVINEKTLGFIKGDLETLGLKLGRFSDLPNHLDSLLDLTLEVTKKTRDEFANVYFNKRLNVPAGTGASRPPADHDPGNTPF